MMASDGCRDIQRKPNPGRHGLHDSSAALIPYQVSFNEPFILLSTGTWCISLNVFNHTRLTNTELNQDCLCYLSYEGKPVKASRLFAGYEHEQQTKKLAEYFIKPPDYYKTMPCDAGIFKKRSNLVQSILQEKRRCNGSAISFSNKRIEQLFQL